ncbi:MAG: coiled-coil domain-containing protein, partial [Chloroflexota bacterium]
ERERQAAVLAELGQSATAVQDERQRCLAAVDAAARELERRTEVWAQTRALLARLVERQESAERERLAQLALAEEATGRLEAGREGLRAGQSELATLVMAGDDLAARAAAAERALDEAEAEARAAEHHLEERRRERQVLQARLAVLERWRQDFSGYHAGARAVLQAARAGRGERLAGVVGVVASLLRVPAELETAVEVALGGRLQDVVVERWRDAEAAIEFLKRSRAGRATFLPLDTIRASASASPAVGPGVLGLASELVDHDPAHATVVRFLLGRTLVVQDLPTARRALGGCPGGWQIVTLAGEVVRSSGAVTGGTLAQQAGGLLAQERELRDLPERLKALEGTLTAAERQLVERRGAARERRTEVANLVGEQRQLEGRRGRLEADLAAREREAERLRREALRATQAAEAAATGARAAAERVAAAEVELGALEGRREASRQTQEAARVALARAEVAGGDSLRRLAEARGALAAAQREAARLGALAAEREAEHARARAADEQLATEDAGLAAGQIELEGSLSALEAVVEELGERRRQLGAQEAARREGEAAVARDLAELDRRRQDGQRRLAGLAATQAAGAATVQRLAADLAGLRERVAGDPGLTLPEDARQPRLPWEEEAGPALQEANPEALRRQIDQLRGQLRGLSAINPEAVRDYEELSARHSFLTAQHADLQQAGRSLHQAIADLEALMRKQFERTFVAVAAEFRRYFTILFGGGTARLTLTESQNVLEAGVDIVAQPPGKRWQSLALLSGGERALTAVALLFALLSVKPAPVCVLDEVDAALDDSNVARCLDLLRALSAHTQFVIITHNRVTMEAAGALYGVSIGRDGVSRVVSLRLEDLPPQA